MKFRVYFKLEKPFSIPLPSFEAAKQALDCKFMGACVQVYYSANRGWQDLLPIIQEFDSWVEEY